MARNAWDFRNCITDPFEPPPWSGGYKSLSDLAGYVGVRRTGIAHQYWYPGPGRPELRGGTTNPVGDPARPGARLSRADSIGSSREWCGAARHGPRDDRPGSDRQSAQRSSHRDAGE